MSEDERPVRASGRCLCGVVQFEIRGPLRPVVYCHCTMCRRSSGHFVAATACAPQDLQLKSAETLRWYQSSASARRGFCVLCGSSLFWEPRDGTYVAVMAGTLDGATGLTAREHIFVREAGDYYTICDGLPESATVSDAADITIREPSR
jgi:hypothetical protein